MHNLPRALRLRQLHTIAPHLHQTHQIRRIASQSHRNGQSLRVQPVRFRSGPIKRTATLFPVFAGLIAVPYALLILLTACGFENFDAEERVNEIKELSPEEIEEQVDNAHFLPLSWPEKQPRTYYAGDDPEWQEFIRVAKDHDVREQINSDAMQLVSDNAMKHPVISKWLGADIHYGRCWIEFHFPDGPPEEYSWGGIFLAEKFVGSGTQDVPHDEYEGWKRVIRPVATGQSAWAAVKVLVGMQMRRIGQATGYTKVNPSSPEEKYKLWRQLVQHHDAMLAATEAPAGKTPTPPTSSNDGSADPNASLASKKSSANSSQPSGTSPIDRRLISWLVPDPSSDGASSSPRTLDLSHPSANSFSNLDLPVATMVFFQTYSKITAPKLRDYRDIPRGHFIVQGLIELKGANGRVQFDLMTAYDPEEKEFVKPSIRLRGHYPRMQAPRGGPGTGTAV